MIISDEWRWKRTHWHAYLIPRTDPEAPRSRFRHARLRGDPDAILASPVEVADWIDTHLRAHLVRRKTWAPADREWVEIGDPDDLDHARRCHFATASRGDSLYLDIPTATTVIDLFLEAIPDEHCDHPGPEPA